MKITVELSITLDIENLIDPADADQVDWLFEEVLTKENLIIYSKEDGFEIGDLDRVDATLWGNTNDKPPF